MVLQRIIFEAPHDKTNGNVACVPSQDSDQPEDPIFLHVDSEDSGGCPGWSESSLGAHAILLVLSRGSSFHDMNVKLLPIFKCTNIVIVCEIRAKYCIVRSTYLSQLVRLWYFSSSVNSFFKRACAAIQWARCLDFWSDLSSTSILHVGEQWRLWRDITYAQTQLSLRWSLMWQVP